MTEFCSYPACQCPADAPADPSWCHKGLPHAYILRACNTCRFSVDGKTTILCTNPAIGENPLFYAVLKCGPDRAHYSRKS